MICRRSAYCSRSVDDSGRRFPLAAMLSPRPTGLVPEGKGIAMRRIILVSGAVSFLMAFLGTLVALTLATPIMASAQEARATATGLTVVRADGLAGMTADVRPTGGGLLQILGVDGQTLRGQFG